MNEGKDEIKDEWGKLQRERMKKRTRQACEWMNGRTDEQRAYEWKDEQRNGRSNQRTTDRTKEGTKEYLVNLSVRAFSC